ncbi:hypothetical protein DWF04_015370 [Cereibacter sphaeroides f. sp. denitrificans]
MAPQALAHDDAQTSVLALHAGFQVAVKPRLNMPEEPLRQRSIKFAMKKRAALAAVKSIIMQKRASRKRPALRALPVETVVCGNARDLSDEDLAGFDMGL